MRIPHMEDIEYWKKTAVAEALEEAKEDGVVNLVDFEAGVGKGFDEAIERFVALLAL